MYDSLMSPGIAFLVDNGDKRDSLFFSAAEKQAESYPMAWNLLVVSTLYASVAT